MVSNSPELVDSEARADLQPYIIVRLKGQQLAISATCVKQFVLMPKAVAIPSSPPEIRGVVNIRGTVMPLLDLRALLGMPSFIQDAQEIVKTLQQREQDHRNWLTELQASVKEKRPFALARDPHQCKFGKWYDTYKPENQSVAFLSLWHAFDSPHRRIHGIADVVCGLAAKGDHDGANAIIEATRDCELKEMIGLFEEVGQMLSQTNREVAMILEHAHRHLAVCVDEVVAIETLDKDTIEPLSELVRTEQTVLTPRVARRPGLGQMALILDAPRLFDSAVKWRPFSARHRDQRPLVVLPTVRECVGVCERLAALAYAASTVDSH